MASSADALTTIAVNELLAVCGGNDDGSAAMEQSFEAQWSAAEKQFAAVKAAADRVFGAMGGVASAESGPATAAKPPA